VSRKSLRRDLFNELRETQWKESKGKINFLLRKISEFRGEERLRGKKSYSIEEDDKSYSKRAGCPPWGVI